MNNYIAEMDTGTYSWAAPVVERFKFTAHTCKFKYYTETGEMREVPDNLVFNDGTLRFMDSRETMIVSATNDCRAVFLIEFHDIIVAAFKLSKDRGLLIKHLKEKGGQIPIAYKNFAVGLIVLSGNAPFVGHIRVNSLQEGHMDQKGTVRINYMANGPRIQVPESLMIMYQHLRNVEKAGIRPVNKHTFAEHEISSSTNRYPYKDIGKMCRVFTENEAMQWLEKAKNLTPVELALQKEFVFGQKSKCIISFPKQLEDYVKIWCKQLGFIERALFDEGEEIESSSGSDDETNSQDSGEPTGAASLAWQDRAKFSPGNSAN